MTSGVLSLLKGTATCSTCVLIALDLILRLISAPNCLARNLTSLGLPTFDAASYLVCQGFPYLFAGFRCEEHGKSCSNNCSDTKCNRRFHCGPPLLRVEKRIDRTRDSTSGGV